MDDDDDDEWTTRENQKLGGTRCYTITCLPLSLYGESVSNHNVKDFVSQPIVHDGGSHAATSTHSFPSICYAMSLDLEIARCIGHLGALMRGVFH
jgi:hypothetical protein